MVNFRAQPAYDFKASEQGEYQSFILLKLVDGQLVDMGLNVTGFIEICRRHSHDDGNILHFMKNQLTYIRAQRLRRHQFNGEIKEVF